MSKHAFTTKNNNNESFSDVWLKKGSRFLNFLNIFLKFQPVDMFWSFSNFHLKSLSELDSYRSLSYFTTIKWFILIKSLLSWNSGIRMRLKVNFDWRKVLYVLLALLLAYNFVTFLIFFTGAGKFFFTFFVVQISSCSIHQWIVLNDYSMNSIHINAFLPKD